MEKSNELNTIKNEAQAKSEDDLYTLAEIRKLSSEDVKQNWDKVARSLKHISGEED